MCVFVVFFFCLISTYDPVDNLQSGREELAVFGSRLA